MLSYREVMDYNRKCFERYLKKYQRVNETLFGNKEKTTVEAMDKGEIVDIVDKDELINVDEAIDEEIDKIIKVDKAIDELKNEVTNKNKNAIGRTIPGDLSHGHGSISVSDIKNTNININANNEANISDASDINTDRNDTKPIVIPGTIRELLKMFLCRRVTIVLNAHQNPQVVKIRDIIGNILVAETVGETKKSAIKFVNINCICEVIITQDELLESILSHN